MNAPVPIWLFLLVLLLLTGAFWPLVKVAVYSVIIPIVYLIRWWPIVLGLLLGIFIVGSIISDTNFENQATREHPSVRQITLDRYHHAGQFWIHNNFRHSIDENGMETVVPVN